MKPNRRGFLGLMGGAVAAGPKLAADIAGSVPPSASYYGGESAQSIGGDSWKIERIADLKRLISGHDPRGDYDRRMRTFYLNEQRDRYRIDALRSVSMVHKHFMFHEAEAERDGRRRKLEWQHELSHLTGGLISSDD